MRAEIPQPRSQQGEVSIFGRAVRLMANTAAASPVPASGAARKLFQHFQVSNAAATVLEGSGWSPAEPLIKRDGANVRFSALKDIRWGFSHSPAVPTPAAWRYWPRWAALRPWSASRRQPRYLNQGRQYLLSVLLTGLGNRWHGRGKVLRVHDRPQRNLCVECEKPRLSNRRNLR
jgi:hypothetical protein